MLKISFFFEKKIHIKYKKISYIYLNKLKEWYILSV